LVEYLVVQTAGLKAAPRAVSMVVLMVAAKDPPLVVRKVVGKVVKMAAKRVALSVEMLVVA
jgi:hypothetical protein